MGPQLDFTPQELSNFWKKGKSLYAALYEFTDSLIREKCKNLESERNERTKNYLENGLPTGQTISEGFENISKGIFLSQAIDKARDDLKYDLLSKIISERLIGLGYETPIKSSDIPQIIPLHIWPQKIKEINWEDSSLSKSGIKFLDIRLIKKPALKKPSINKINERQKLLPKIEDKKTGRPSHGDKITAIYDLLEKEGKINYSKPLKWNIQLIRATLLHHYPELGNNPKGLGDDAISNKISARFNAGKLADKPT